MTQENIGNGTAQAGNQPEKKFRAGAVSATVWLNQGQNKKTGEISNFRTISLQRGYKDQHDQWQNTGNMRINDLPRAALVLKQAYEYLVTASHESLNSNSAVDNTTTLTEEPVM